MTSAALHSYPDVWRSEENAFTGLKDRVNILVVDDLPEKLLAYEAILDDMGQNLVKAQSGEEALKLVLRHEFAVILLDVNMPGMDGFETAALIRKRRKSSHTPIIFLTAFTDEMRMAQGYASGAVDYLPTPVVPEVLKAKVKVFIELSQMRRQAASQAEERAMRKAAEQSARRSAFLMTASEALGRAHNQAEIVRKLAQLPLPQLADMGMVWWAPEHGQPPKLEWAWVSADGQIHSELLPEEALAPSLKDMVDKVLETGQLQAATTPLDYVEAMPIPITGYQQGSNIISLKSAIGLPLSIRDRICGVLIMSRHHDQIYKSADVSLATDLASRASIALENIMLLEKIQEADHRKDEFLAMLAHELRNPLAPIRNAVQILKSSPNNSLREQAQDTIERQIKHMVHLVDDLMDVSRITQGKIELRREPVKLHDLLQHAVEIARPLIDQRKHKLSITLPEEEVWLHADAGRVSQVFSNLLNNSAKYTNDGGVIELKAELKDDKIEISVSDNGIGIPPHMLSRIFDMFSQVDTSLERTQGGLGIGLTLVKSLVEMHGGNITVFSNGLDKGSCFAVTLATCAPAQPVISESSSQPVASGPLRILVVDDNEASAKTMGWMVELSGHETHLAHDGPSAIEKAQNCLPSVVLLDIGLPGMNGYEVCKAMRQDPRLKNTVFIAQTGWGQEEHRRRSKEAGFDHHLVKPVELSTLQELLGTIA